MRRDDELEKLRPHPLARNLSDRGAVADCRAQSLGVDAAAAELRGKTKKAKDAKVVLANARVGVADETHAAMREVVETAEGIVHLAVAVQRHCVDGEVAAARVSQEIAAKVDLGMTSVRLDVLAQGGGLDRLALHDEDDGAM